MARGDLGLAVVRLRPIAEVTFFDQIRLELGWDVLPVMAVGSNLQQLAVAPQNRLRLADFKPVLYQGDGMNLQHNLDRLFLRWIVGQFELRIGRQAIGHGGARLLPSADLFGPFGPGAVATEFKRGVDAIRLTRPIGDAWELELFAVMHRGAQGDESPDTGLRDGVYLARVLWRVPEMLDASILVGMSYRLPTFALALNGDVWGAGWYLEGSGRWDKEADAEIGDPQGPLQLRLTAGLDRQWQDQWRTLVEVSYQSTGMGGADLADPLSLGQPAVQMSAAAQRLPIEVGEGFLLGRWYAAAMVSKPFRDLHSLQCAAIVNLQDGSALVMPGVSFSMSDDVTLAIGALLSFGKRPTRSIAGITVPRSELGSGPMLGYLDVRTAW
ncbi:MAG TPA: hypothetical protein DCQ06_13775 [Myxococcales bacterium]|nr:hypothetical protein [Myxococcales bacterium]